MPQFLIAASAAEPSTVVALSPVIVGVVFVLVAIVAFRLHAFFALLLGAYAVSFTAGWAAGWDEERHALAAVVTRVPAEFGVMAGKIGVLIGMAAVIGSAMTASGASNTIVKASLSAFGVKRAVPAMTTAGFVLSIPVFFDTVVYLVAPLARATHRAMGDRGYLKYLMAVGAGGATAHSLVLPTPGPLVIAGILGVSVGTMLLVGLAVAVPTAVVGGIAAVWFADRMGERQPPSVGEVTADEEARAAAPGDVMEQAQEPTATNDPGLALALLPVVLPVLLISSNTAIGPAFPGESNAVLANVKSVAAVVGDPSVALTLAAAASVFVLCRQTGRSLRDLVTFFESAVTDAGPIILITSAGGSFGAMLKLAELKIAVSNMTGGAELAGLGALVLAFIVTIIVKVAQGSSTAAMTIAGGIVAGLLVSDVPPGELASALAAACGFHPVYLAVAIGSGAIVGAWMNDSGFWIFTKFAGLSPVEGLKTWTPLMSILGVTAFLTTLLLASVFPMAG